MSTAGRPGVPLAVLRRVTRSRPAPLERCDMCATPVQPDHSHIVDLQSRALMCACRACYLLFTDDRADLRYRAVPDRYLSFGGPGLDEQAWDELQIPVGLAFLFRNSAQDRMVAFYPGPAGATESELPLPAWNRMVARDPRLSVLRPDVEALLVRRSGSGEGAASCHLVPIDACYELVGQLRSRWHGFDGGREAHDAINAFFSRVRARSRPVPHG
ncbi:MAG TPA: DUF5947 family protein [Actinoplanes sp.]